MFKSKLLFVRFYIYQQKDLITLSLVRIRTFKFTDQDLRKTAQK